MKHLVTFTHKGWFGICPVYFADLKSDAPMVDPRHWLLSPLMWLSEWGYSVSFLCIGILRLDVEPTWPLEVTGELSPQVIREFEAADDGLNGR